MGPNVHSHAHTHTPTHLRHHSIEFIVMYESHAEWSNQLQTKSKPLKNYHEFQAHTKKGKMRNKKRNGAVKRAFQLISISYLFIYSFEIDSRFFPKPKKE